MTSDIIVFLNNFLENWKKITILTFHWNTEQFQPDILNIILLTRLKKITTFKLIAF